MEFSVKYLPIINLLVLSLTLGTTLSITELSPDKAVSDGFPYFGDIGTLPPASCIFGQSCNVLWILFSFSTYIKYRQTRHLFIKHSIQRYKMLNKITLYIGLLASFGFTIAANFQETYFLIVHWISATLVFGFGGVYQCLQTTIYMKLLSFTLILEKRPRSKLRIVVSAVSVVSFCTFFICGMASYYKKNGANEVSDYVYWRNKEEGYNFHIISTIAEWICGASTMTFLTLFYGEFSQVTVQEPDVFVEDESTNTETLQSTAERLEDK